MSGLSDDEALFDDIYGEDEQQVKQDAKPETSPTAESGSTAPASTAESTSTANTTTDAAPAPAPAAPAPAAPAAPSAPAAPAAPAAPSAPSAPASAPSQPPAMPLPPAGMGMPDFSQLQQQFGGAMPPQPPQTMAPSNMGRDSGKMFIGGLNWDTTEEGLVNYFSKYGEVADYTIMRDSSTGRSRGFGFLTFKDPRSVDEVVKADHVLDGKLIDPKRAIAREEQDKVGKIFVGGIDPLVTEQEFNEFFSQYGHIIDAQLMIDKDTGRSRGFGFITYDSPEAVDRVCVNKYVSFKGKSMEVKRAEPRNQHQQSQQLQQQLQYGYNPYSQYGQQAAYGQYGANMTPEMVEYWQRMQQWYMYQQQQAEGGEGELTEQPGQPLNPQQQGEGEGIPTGPKLEAQQSESGFGGDRRGGYGNKDHGSGRDYGSRDDYGSGGYGNGGYGGGGYGNGRRDGPPRGPRRGGGPSGPRGGFRGRGGYNRRGGYHPYSRGGGRR